MGALLAREAEVGLLLKCLSGTDGDILGDLLPGRSRVIAATCHGQQTESSEWDKS